MRFLVLICLCVTLCAALPKKREANLCDAIEGGVKPGWMEICADGTTCIYSDWMCDGEADCPDGDDEEHEQCGDDEDADLCTMIDENGVVPWWMRVCEDQAKCIFEDWLCDGEEDCFDGSDEQECSAEGEEPVDLCEYIGTGDGGANPDWLMECDSGDECYLDDWSCDKEQDCKDGSDEKEADCAATWAETWGPYRSGRK